MTDERAQKFNSENDAIAHAAIYGHYSVLRLIGRGFVVTRETDEMRIELPDGEWLTLKDLRRGSLLPINHRQYWVAHDSIAHEHLKRKYDAEVLWTNPVRRTT